ncbi:MAG: 3-phosphoshikimate 1-carboxyvinyltransferase [bacterium]
MEQLQINPTKSLKGIIELPGDKSISHRAVIISSLANGVSEIENFLEGEDCLRTLNNLQKLGVKIEKKDKKIFIYGSGLFGLKEANDILDVGNSGTTIRLLCGLLSGQNFYSVLTGDESIKKRPMDRVINPLTQMGARIFGRINNSYAPLAVAGGKLRPISYLMPTASAQVKSAILLAGLLTEGETEVIEKVPSRNHTELMLKHFGAKIKTEGLKIKITGSSPLQANKIKIPGDISSAAFFIVGASILEGSDIVIRNVGINFTRGAIIDILKMMGADIQILENKTEYGGEETADIRVKGSPLKGVTIEGDIIPRIIDEIPILAIAGLFAEGETIIRGAGELRIKETDRIKALSVELQKSGAEIEELPDGMIIRGNRDINGTAFESYNDHRMAMSLAIMGLRAKGKTVIKNTSCIKTSFPDFEKTLNNLVKGE